MFDVFAMMQAFVFGVIVTMPLGFYADHKLWSHLKKHHPKQYAKLDYPSLINSTIITQRLMHKFLFNKEYEALNDEYVIFWCKVLRVLHKVFYAGFAGVGLYWVFMALSIIYKFWL
mgnify:FL=1